jgi:periplasmic protein CpxP/Spy
MDNSRFLKIVIVVLLIINIATLAFLWTAPMRHGPPPMRGEDVAGFLSRELNFTPEQQKQFEELRKEHHDNIDNIRQQDREMHDKFFDLLCTNPVDSAFVGQMADSMSGFRKQIELLTFYHFQKVRGICTAEQQKKFDEVIDDALRMMAPKPQR